MPAPTATEQFVNWLTGKPMALFDAVGSIFNPSGPNSTPGLVPSPGATPGTTKFLREDSTWVMPTAGIPDSVITNRILGRITTPPDPGPAEQLTGTQVNTILPAFTPDSGAGGVKGLVPAPAAGDGALFKSLNADGTFKGNMVLLGEGTNTNQATLDISINAFQVFRSFIIDLNVLPLTDGVDLWSRFSPDNINFDATGYAYASIGVSDAPAAAGLGAAAANQIIMNTTGAGTQIGNAATEGWKGQINILNPFSTTFWPRILFTGAWGTNAATPATSFISGQGTRKAAQHTLSVRFMFSSGNITYTYALYGLP